MRVSPERIISIDAVFAFLHSASNCFSHCAHQQIGTLNRKGAVIFRNGRWNIALLRMRSVLAGDLAPATGQAQSGDE